jgi:hypothetical protein
MTIRMLKIYSNADSNRIYLNTIISNLRCRVKTAANANSTVVLRKNGANGNETFSIGANTTGAFSDATDTDSIASGDKIAVAITPGSTALVITIIAAKFSSTNMSDTVTHMLSFQDLSSQPTVTGTYYSTPSELQHTEHHRITAPRLTLNCFRPILGKSTNVAMACFCCSLTMFNMIMTNIC